MDIMMNAIRRLLIRQSFHPSFIGIFLNPVFLIRRGLLNGIANNSSYMKGKLLDFGCGSKPYKELFNVEKYIGLDIEKSGHDHRKSEVDVFYDGKTIPFPDDNFDSVFTSEVLEHVFNIDDMIPEIRRILKPNGYILITVPFVWDEHEVPYDFGRYSTFGIKHIMEKHGFEVIKIDKSTNFVETVFQLWSIYIYRHILPSNDYIKLILTPFFIAPITILGIILSKILPKNNNLYHNNIVVAKKISM